MTSKKVKDAEGMMKEMTDQSIGLVGSISVVEDHSDSWLSSQTPTRHSTDETWEKTS